MFLMAGSFSDRGSVPAAPGGESIYRGRGGRSRRQTRLDRPRPLFRILLRDQRPRTYNLLARYPSPTRPAGALRVGTFVPRTEPVRPGPRRGLLRPAAGGTIIAERSPAGRVSHLRATSPARQARRTSPGS